MIKWKKEEAMISIMDWLIKIKKYVNEKEFYSLKY